MFTYSGYLRESDDWPVDGVDWTSNACIDNLCNRGLPTGSESSDTLHGQELSTSRRIDMAAIINGHSASPEFAPPKDVEATDGEMGTLRTREDLSANDSYDTASEATEGNMCGRGAWCCTPCICRVCTALLIVMALFAVGLGVGLAPRDESSGQNSVAASTGIDPEADTSSGRVPALDLIPTSSPTGASVSSDPPKVQSPSSPAPSPAPSTIPSPTQTSTSFPTQNPTLFPTIYFEWDDNYEDWLVDDDEVPIVGENTNGQENQGDGVNGEETDGVGDEANGGGNEGTSTNADKEENNNDQGTEMDWGTSGSPYLVGVYYYPWHGNDFHNQGGYLRRDLVPKHMPTLGEYDDSRPETISQHLQWSGQANIGLWITSWWGPNRLEDSNTKDVIMRHENLGDLKIALHYETSNRVRGGLTGISNDMEYLCQNYFDHPNYYKIDGRPVIFVYVTRKLESEGNLEPTILTMRTSASKCGHDVYLVGDHVFESAPDEAEVFVPFWYFDAVTNYDVYGSMGRPSPHAGRTAVDNYYLQQSQWRSSAHASGCRYIPAVSPGYNDRSVRYHRDHPPMSRKLTANSAEGSLFSYQLSRAKPLVDPEVDNLLVVNSFNEWHEDTQIEPTMGERTNIPFNLTRGVYYEGYGELYLNLLRESTIR